MVTEFVIRGRKTIRHRAPKGGIEIGGRFYRGGWFIPTPKENLMKYLVKSGSHYVKAYNGQPTCYSTQNLRDAARFDSKEAAQEWTCIFSGSMRDTVEIVTEEPKAPTTSSRPRRSSYDRFNDEPNMPWEHYMGR